MSSINYNDAEAFRNYVEKKGWDLLTRMFYGFETAQLVTTHDGIKGKLVLTELILGDLFRRWSKTFNPLTNAIKFVPRELVVDAAKIDLSIYPQEFESSYLGEIRKKGQNPRDFPFEAFILEKVIAKAMEELEDAAWQGVKTASPESTDKLNLLFDGYLEIIRKAIAATDITPVTTGVITDSNVVQSVENVFDFLHPAVKKSATMAFVSVETFTKYQRNYRSDFGKYTDADGMRAKLDFANCTLVGIAGMGNSDRIIITPASNLHLGYDDINDFRNLRFNQDKRELQFWLDAKMGCQIGLLQDGMIAVNEQV